MSGFPSGGGGGGSGTITDPLTTKGDLWGFTTTDARLGVGADNSIPVADSTQAIGISYKTAAQVANIITPQTTKGDLIGYGSGGGAVPTRIPVGADGLVFQADSTEALGVEYDVVGPSGMGIVTTKGDLLGYDTAPNRIATGTDYQLLEANSANAAGVGYVTLPARRIAGGPGTYGLLGLSVDPAAESTLAAVNLQVATLLLVKIPAPYAMTITNVIWYLDTAGATLTNCYTCIFTSNGTVRGQSADKSAEWSNAGNNSTMLTDALVTPYVYTPSVEDDFIWAGLYVGTNVTPVKSRPAQAASAVLTNFGLTNATARAATIALANTGTITSFTPSGLSKSNNVWVIGIS